MHGVTEECEACARLRERLTRVEESMLGHWTLDDERFRARDLAALEVAKALEAFKALSNEWRGALSDLAATKIDTATYDARHAQLEQRIENGLRATTEKIDAAIGNLSSRLDGQAVDIAAAKGGTRALVTGVAVLGTIVGIVFAVLVNLR